jgi:transposase-like protein
MWWQSFAVACFRRYRVSCPDCGIRCRFIIAGSKALRSASEEVFGDRAHVQRCRTHKVRRVTERLPQVVTAQVKSAMHAACQRPGKKGMTRLRQQAKWLATDCPYGGQTA